MKAPQDAPLGQRVRQLLKDDQWHHGSTKTDQAAILEGIAAELRQEARLRS